MSLMCSLKMCGNVNYEKIFEHYINTSGSLCSVHLNAPHHTTVKPFKNMYFWNQSCRINARDFFANGWKYSHRKAVEPCFFSFRIHLQWDEFVISWRSSCMVFIPNLFSFIQVLCPFIWIGLKSFFLRYQRTVQGLKIEGVGPRFTTFLIESQPEKKRQKTTQDNWRGCVFLSEGALANAKREV